MVFEAAGLFSHRKFHSCCQTNGIKNSKYTNEINQELLAQMLLTRSQDGATEERRRHPNRQTSSSDNPDNSESRTDT